MPNSVAENIAKCSRGLVVGPAGCGKTQLIAEAVGYAQGRQLVLTHTHAGVDALRTKLAAVGVPPAKRHVTTIDSLALCYSSAFPQLAGWDLDFPSSDDEWRALRMAASRLFRCRAPRRVLRSSYAGMFVDEYQDCCGTQHEMIQAIAEVLPCRVVGDPLQAIYRKLHATDVAKWSEVEQAFPVIDELTEPHRWRERNPELGDWLRRVRSRLKEGNEIDFNDARGIVEWVSSADVQDQTAACRQAFDKNSVVAICDWPARCAAVASRTKNHFAVLESVECPDLLRAADEIENSIALDRVARVVALARKCLTRMTGLNALLDRMKKGIDYRPRSPDKLFLWNAMQMVAKSAELRRVEDLMVAINGISDAHSYVRRELWQDMRRTLKSHDSRSGRSLRQSARALREHSRKNGRRILSKRIVATPLLIKGLEFDHALLLDATRMKSAEELYVALTRGSTSLTVLSPTPRIRRPEPAWIREGSSRSRSLQ